METSSERAAHGEYDDTTRSTTSDDDLRGVTRGSARVTPRALEERAPGAPAQGDFWSRVVSTQHALQQHPQCPPGEALGLAIAWAVAASGLEPAPTGRGAVAGKPGGAPAASASHVGRATSARADAPSSVDLQQWVSHLHSDLSERASRALVVAWEQRGSALRAVTYDKG
jgi:hypothetical protein